MGQGVADGDKEIIVPKYRAIICFRNGIAWAPIDGRRQWCPLGPDGAERDRPACMVANYPDDGDTLRAGEIPRRSVREQRAVEPRLPGVCVGQRDCAPRWVSDRMR